MQLLSRQSLHLAVSFATYFVAVIASVERDFVAAFAGLACPYVAAAKQVYYKASKAFYPSQSVTPAMHAPSYSTPVSQTPCTLFGHRMV